MWKLVKDLLLVFNAGGVKDIFFYWICCRYNSNFKGICFRFHGNVSQKSHA